MTDRRANGRRRTRRAAPPATRTGCCRRACRSPPCCRSSGLLVIAFVTLSLSNGNLPFTPGANGGRRAAGDRPGPGADADAVERRRCPEPRGPRHRGPGTLVYAKDGNIWTQTGDQAKQLTSSGARLDARRSPRTASSSTSSGPAARRQVEHRRLDQGLRARRAHAHARQERRQRLDGATARRHHEPGPAASSGTGSSASRSSRPTAATSRWRPTCPTRPRATSRSSCSTLKTDKIRDLKLSQVAPLGPPGSRPGSPTAASCSTSGTTVTAPRARRGSTRGTRTPGRRVPSPGPATSHPPGRPTAGTSRRRRRRRTGPTS